MLQTKICKSFQPLIFETPHETRERIAKKTGTTPGDAKTTFQFARVVYAAEEVVPGIKQDILSQGLSINKSLIGYLLLTAVSGI